MNIEVKQIYRLVFACTASFVGLVVGLGFGMNYGGNYPVPFEYAYLPGYEGAGLFGSLVGAVLFGTVFIALGSWLRGYRQVKRLLAIGFGIGTVEVTAMHFLFLSIPQSLPLALLLIAIPPFVMLIDEWRRSPQEQPRHSHIVLIESAFSLGPLLLLSYFLLGVFGIIG